MLLITNAEIIRPQAPETSPLVEKNSVPTTGTAPALQDVLIGDDGRIARIIPAGEGAALAKQMQAACEADAGAEKTLETIDAAGRILTAGFADPHVHFRDPGQTWKEDMTTGSAAARRGGYTTVIMMGNTIPHPDTPEHVREMAERGAQTGIHAYVCGNVTMEMEGRELTDFAALKEAGAILLTDDGKPLCDAELMRRACEQAAKLDLVVSLHEEDPAKITNNGIHAGKAAEMLGLAGSPREAEISMVERDIEIARQTDCTITVQHISAAESVDLIRKARAEGVSVHAEGTPHHFTLTDMAVLKYGSLAKMNPPLRTEADRMAIIEGLKDGTIDMIATDHAPHAREEKGQELTKAPSGITGLETAFSLALRELVQPGYLTLPQLFDRMSAAPCRLYGLPGGTVEEGGPADLVLLDVNASWRFDVTASKSFNTPFMGQTLPGVICMTICGGRIVYQQEVSL